MKYKATLKFKDGHEEVCYWASYSAAAMYVAHWESYGDCKGNVEEA